MSSIMRWRRGLMGLSDIAKAPVSHGVEPHDLETGPDLRVPRQPTAPHRTSPPLPRERFRCYGARRGNGAIVANETMERPMPQLNDLSRSLVALEQDATLIAVIEMGQSSWLVAGVVPGIERQKLAADPDGLLQLLHLERPAREGRNATVHLLARVVGVGVETA